MSLAEENVPSEFLGAIRPLLARPVIEREFVDMCLLVVKIIDTQKTTEVARTSMAYMMSLNLQKGAHGDLDGIRMEFIGDLEIFFSLEDPSILRIWNGLKESIAEADKKYTRVPLGERSEHIPQAFAKRAQKLAYAPYTAEHEFVKLCEQAVKIIDANPTDKTMHSNMAYHLTEVWYRHDNIRFAKLLDAIGLKFGEWEVPGAFNVDFIVGGYEWEKQKTLIRQAIQAYPLVRKSGRG